MRVSFNDDAYFRGLINNVVDYPKPGIVFRDISPLLRNGEAFQKSIDLMTSWIKNRFEYDQVAGVVGIESRGFIFGAAVAATLGVGFVMCRKSGKLPGEVHSSECELEYGKAVLEMGRGSVRNSGNYFIVDDVLATGGTADATVRLVQTMGGSVAAILSLVELSWLRPDLKLLPVKTYSLVKYTNPGI